ncbi:TIGR01841 family phasin [Aquamicrobium sp. LC103]|uniref:phasin family protein n=1 Tax=Aquamicrobium sp. LC103 TaxID=1120658 RepID=UPI00063EA30D|nr:TIGR01841 family phasin [Aquamicrobium sp. LC103]TKT79137.1 phasin family protein [Aquamicrobium sp. LC103]
MAKKAASESVIDMFARLGQDLRLSGTDIERIIEHNRRNLEAFEQSARAAASGTSAILSRQREMLQDTLREVSDMAQNYRASSDPQELMSKQVEFARKSFETAVKNTGEVADLARQSSTEALEILRQRIREGMQEIREGFDRRK